MYLEMLNFNSEVPMIKATIEENIARIANAVQCHNKLSGNKDCHE